MSLSLYLACFFLLSFPLGSASAQSSSSQNSSYDWTFKNPPEPVHIHDQFQPYLSVDIDSKPIADKLPPDSSPLTKLLNQYEVVQVHPNLDKIEWNQDIDKDLRGTRNILAELDSYVKFHTKPTPVKKATHTVGNVAVIIVVAPIAILGFIFMAPLMIPLMREEREAERNGKTALRKKAMKESEAAEAQLQKILGQTFQQTAAMKASVESLVQKSVENTIPINDLNLKPVQKNQYTILPSTNYYTVDLSNKALLYLPSHKSLTIPIHFKKPYPRKEDVLENFEKSSLKFLPDSGIRFTITGNVRYLPEGFHEHIEITYCSIGYTNNYAYKEVFCNGVNTWR